MASLTTTKLKVHYWPMLGRAGAAIRMLEHTNTDYEHVSDFPSISKLGSAWSGESDTFAPPIVIDGDFQISQSVAVTLYVGNKVGLDKGLNTYKAVQWLNDIVDLFESGLSKSTAAGGAALKVYLEGAADGKPSRFAKQIGNLNRAIKGPFFMGEEPTLVDFFLCQHVDWQHAKLLNRLQKQTNVDIFAPYPNVVSVYEGIRNLDSYKSSGLSTMRDGFGAKDEVFENYK
jgi:glutathione S-transferase